ncbi:PREDICTED: separase isoform X1 [Lupinus angustifolius]|uniref:separase isoform X1 n=1 Tax=Lupinus angustifolius TaxID=3871 RepID=UPI00092E4A61|nr:PREDICTED: separase isoform X1 [Lupinus angustifolius]
MASAVESSLISKLQSSDTAGIYSLVSDYLHPLLTASNKFDQTLIRSLAKRFISFLNSSLSILPKRLPQLYKSLNDDVLIELFRVYTLCLDCLDTVSSQLASKPFQVEFQRLRFIHCFENCSRHRDAEAEGFRVLEKIRAMNVSKKSVRKGKGKGVDGNSGYDNDKDFCLLASEIVVSLVRCAAMGTAKEDEHFKRVLDLVEESRPWFRGLDAISHEKLHSMLVIQLGKCALNFLGTTFSDKDLVITFSCLTLTEYVKSPIKDQVFKIAHRMCSSLLTPQENKSLYIMDILDCVARECKVVQGNAGTDFVELIYYCVYKCQATANASFCSTFAAYLNKVAMHFKQVMIPINPILRLYAAGLLLVSCNLMSKAGDLAYSGSAKFECLHGTLIENDKLLLSSPTLLSSLHICSNRNCITSGVKDKHFIGQACTHTGSDCEVSLTYIPSYTEALKFLCHPLAKSVNSERQRLVTEEVDGSALAMLSTIQDAFHILCHLIISSPSFASEKNGDEFDEKSGTVLNVALAAFTMSIKANLKVQESTQLIKQIVAGKWIEIGGIKYISAALYNIAVVLYRNKKPKEASKVLKLCCKASWICIKCHCGNLSKFALKDIVTEVYTRSVLLLVILHEFDDLKIRKNMIKILKNWSTANDLFETLPAPIPIVKQWVKIQCKCAKHVDERADFLSLYYLMSSSTELSKSSIGMILEQELTAYEEMSFKYPELCQKMQMKITGFLLQDIYVTPDSSFKKAQTLLREAKALRAGGIGGLKDCIQCLSKAITIMKAASSDQCTNKNPIDHQLSVAYCLHALCTQEAEPNSKQIFEDVKAALDIWLNMFRLDCFEEGDCSTIPDSIMILLYNIIDLIQLKGFMDLSGDAYQLVTRIFKLKKVPVEKWLTLLWESRRLSHALCVSPVNEAFIMNSSHQSSELSNIDFWIRHLQGNQSSSVSFQQNFSFLFASSQMSSCSQGSSFRTDITVDEVQKAALELISNAPVSSHSAFLAGYLYYDLCQRLVANGQLIEALSSAKQAHRLHAELFQRKFTRNVQQHNEKHNVMIDFSKNLGDEVEKIGVKISAIRNVLLFDSISWDLKDSYLSPWKILQCYLESTLQVGIIHEMIGDGGEAETYLQWGKAISCSLQLPLFMVTFSSLLGKLYVKKRLWDLAEKELQSAEQILKDGCTAFCCSKCKLKLEVILYQYLGDLCQHKFETRTGVVSEVTAKNLYTSALDKLNLSEWKNPLTCPEEGNGETAQDIKCGGRICACLTINEAGGNVTESVKAGPETKTRAKQNRKTKNAAKVLRKESNLGVEDKPMITRSRCRSSQNQHISISSKSDVGESLEGNNISDSSGMLIQKESVLNKDGCTVASWYSLNCDSKTRCWHCLPPEVMNSGLLNNFINLKWEFVRRQLSMNLLTRLVKCFSMGGHIHETCKFLLRSISVLVSRNPFYQTSSSVSLDYFHHLVAKEIPGDVFALQRAEIVHDICLYSLRSYNSKVTRNIFCNLSSVKFEDLASWLMIAFVLSREVPVIFEKVSKLLAVMYVVSASSEQFSLSSFSKVLGENCWASYFHQASIGTHLTYRFLSHVSERYKGSYVTGSSCIGEGTVNFLRPVPETSVDLAEYVKKFLAGLPSTTIISISLLGHDYTGLLQELLLYPTCVQAWMLVSRLSFKSEPIVMLLPLDSILQASDEDDFSIGSGTLPSCEKPSDTWHCPWGFTVVDDVAPAFKTILEGNYLSSKSNVEDTTHNRMLWWKRRKNLDQSLDKLLRNLEDSWFGSWKCLLLGKLLNCKNFDSVLKNLVNDLRSKCKLDVNEDLVRVILGGSKYMCEGEMLVSQLCLKKDCYIAQVGYCDEARSGILSNAANGFGMSSEVAFHLLSEALNVLEVDDSVNREPIILVLDYEVQMLPWENLPVLRNHEVYRMPSVSSISAVLDNKASNHQEQVERNLVPFPSIDPLDAFYLLNPDGDLSDTQITFESWFRDKNLEGKAGSKPTIGELASALKSHDLFIYFGHGSGSQYIPRHEIQKLENCAATLLMGCSSGSLTLNGSYAPQGVPLSYLLAGSPAIVANLWEVTDKDIDRFGKAMFDAWLKERSDIPTECLECKLLSEEFEALNLKGGKGRAKRKVPKKKLQELAETDSHNCCHRRKVGAFMGKARSVCTLPFLTGASPVCYGVPTGIWRKKNV